MNGDAKQNVTGSRTKDTDAGFWVEEIRTKDTILGLYDDDRG